jgi:hypothetical protein
MDGIKDFRKFQLGREVKHGGAAGTAVAATALMRGPWVGVDDTPVTFPPDPIGYQVESDRSYIPYVLGSIKQGPEPATFEQLPLTLAAAIRAVEVGQADGAGSGKIYHYPWPLTDASVEKTADTLAFTAGTKTIADSADGLGLVQGGDLIRISGAGQAGNNGIFRVVTAAAGAITVSEALTDEAAGAAVTIEILTQTYTAEGGNNVRVERSAYSFPTSFELSGRGGANADAIMLSSSWTTRQWATLAAGFTAGITPQALSEILFSGAKFYIDDVDDPAGTTEAPDTLAGFTYRATTGLAHQFAGNGNLFFAKAHRKGKIQLAATISMYQNAVALAEYDAWRTQTPRLLRIQIDGPALTAAGTAYSNKALVLTMPGKWVKFPEPSDIEGAEVFAAQFRPSYNATAGIAPSITVVNELASLP